MSQSASTTIKDLFADKYEIIVSTYEGLDSVCRRNPAAADQGIQRINNYFQGLVPDDYILFLKSSDGCVLFEVDSLGGYKFFSCEELIAENELQRSALRDLWDEHVVLIGICIGDGDFIGVRISESYSYQIIDCFHEEVPQNWQPISSLFDEYIENLINSKGQKFWLFK